MLNSSRSVQGCSRNYRGDRCSQCNVGSYRLRAECHTCPDTAWLLFLSFALAIIAAVAAAVYLSKKRVNLACLSVGIVRWLLCMQALCCVALSGYARSIRVHECAFDCVVHLLSLPLPPPHHPREIDSPGLHASAEHVCGIRF